MRSVVVTGTSIGLGEAIAKELLEAGFGVIGISRTPNAILLNSISYSEYCFDLGRIEEIPGLCARLVKDHGAQFGLVNNAAIGLGGILATQHNSDIRHVINMNLLSPIILTKYLSREMLAKREGRIINISSVVASTGYSGLSVYAATKAGLLGMTKSLSRELGSRGITVNSLQPGFMRTDMTADLSSTDFEKVIRRAALKRVPELVDIAKIVLFLMGEGGKNITGQSIVIDAGNIA